MPLATAAMTVDATTKPDEVVQVINEYGFAIVPELIDHATCDAVKAELKPHIEMLANTVRPNVDVGTHSMHLNCLVDKSETYQRLAVHPLILACADRMLLPYCSAYTLAAADAYLIGPGETGQNIHRDDMIYPILHPHIPLFLKVMWTIDEFTEENGATRCVPNSHMWEEDREPTMEETIPAIMPPGSALLFHGSLWHCGGANRVDHWRMGVDGTYLLGWLRQQTAQHIAYPPAFAKTLPSQLARLIGYQTHQPYLGQVHAERDLHAVLEEEGAAPGELPNKGFVEKMYSNYGLTLTERPRLSLRDTR